MEIIIIAAMAENRVIGKNNAIPWSIKEDMAHFKELTMGWPCIMGRKTWESLPKRPLPGRLNLVVSTTMEADSSHNVKDFKVVPSLAEALQLCAGYEKVFICGGASIYHEALPMAHKIELTVIRRHCEGDTFFPEIDAVCWTKTAAVDFDEFSFITYTNIKETS